MFTITVHVHFKNKIPFYIQDQIQINSYSNQHSCDWQQAKPQQPSTAVMLTYVWSLCWMIRKNLNIVTGLTHQQPKTTLRP